MQERPLGPDRAGLPDWLLGGRDTIARDVKTVLFVGAGRHQRRAILRAKELGLRVVAVDRNPEAPGLQVADVGEAVDFTDVAAVTEVARRHGVDGVLTVSADRAVPVVAAVAEALGLPGIGTETAHLMTHKIAMRRTLADAGVPQPRFAGARDMQSAPRRARRRRRPGGAEAGRLRRPARDLPRRVGGRRSTAHLHAALAESPTDEAIVESFHDGLELNGIVIARGGEAFPLTLSDRLRPPGIGFGVGWIHVYPASIYADVLAEAERVAVHAVHALGLRDGIAFPQLIVADDGSVRVVECAARIPGGQMADLVRHAVGVDLVEVALRQALGEEATDELVLPQVQAAARDPLPDGAAGAAADGEGAIDRVARPGARGRRASFRPTPTSQVGETIRPVRLDGDRRGYVIATADTSVEALAAGRGGGAAAGGGGRVSCAFDLEHYRELLEAAQAGGYRFAFFDGSPQPGDLLLRHDVDLSLDAALRMAEVEAAAGARATYFLMTGSVFYNLDSHEGERALAAAARARATASASTRSTRASTSTTASSPCSPGTTPTRSTCAPRSTVRST